MKKPVKLVVYHANEDDPKKCTAKKLHRFGFATLEKNIRRLPYHAILVESVCRKEPVPGKMFRLPKNMGLLRWIVLGRQLNKHLNFWRQELRLVRYRFYLQQIR